jgi:predicted metal-dependent hydrolase
MHQLPHSSGPIPYRLKVSTRRRTVGMRVDENGLTVNAPSRIGKKALESMLLERADWIITKLGEWQARQVPEMAWQDGERLLLLGNQIQLCLTPDSRSRKPQLEAGRLLISMPEPENRALVSRKVLQWYRREALGDFARRVQLLAGRLGVTVQSISLSSARTRWGSCNSRGEIRLNWRLIQAPPHLIHYVAAHELAHLKEMNHSPKFWAIVEKLCPEYASARQELKALSAQLHRMG